MQLVAQLGSAVLRHDGVVRGVVVTPDGKRIVSVGDGVQVWSAETGEPLATLVKRGSGHQVVAVSPDGTRVAAGGIHVQVIDLHLRKVIVGPIGHVGGVRAVAFASDNTLVLGGSGGLRAFDAHGAETTGLHASRAMPSGHRGEVKAIAIAHGRMLACSSDGTITLQALDGRVLASWHERATSCGFSPDGTLVWTAGHGHATIRGLTSGKVVFEEHAESLRTAAMSPDGGRFAIATADAVHVFALPGKRAIARLGFAAETLAFTPDGKRLVVTNTGHGRGESGINIFDVDAERRVLPADRGHTGAIAALAATEHVVFSLGIDDAAILMWDLETGTPVERIGQLAGEGRAIAVTPDADHLITTASGEALVAWNVRRTERSAYPAEGEVGLDIALSPSGAYVAYQTYSPPTVQLFDRSRERVMVVRGTRGHRPGLVAFAGDDVLVALSSDAVIAVRIPTKDRIWVISDFHSVSAICVAGSTVVIGAPDGALVAYDVRTGGDRRPLRTSGREVLRACAVDADHVAVLVRAEDFESSTVELWRLSERRTVGRTDLGVGARALAASPDGKRLYVGTNTSRVLVFEWN